MAAQTSDRRVQSYETGARVKESIGAAANAVWYQGSLVCINASGFGVRASDAANLRVLGIATNRGDNTGGSNGALTIEYEFGGVYEFLIDGATITDAARGLNAIVLDDQTMTNALTATNDIPAGQIVAVRGSRVFVKVGDMRQANV